ncbi:MAG: hypothetical protein LBS66_02680 [Rhodospirillaceae bacterium]|jgi:SH3-like domain-containing protein|nr:hypothetical protein [Rhodospirillaceae bacterium]
MFIINDDAKSGDLPLPRFVSLRSDKINLRTGPGVRYPIDWIYVHSRLPVEVIAQFENWRKIRDWQKVEGWVHQSMLSSKRTIIIIDEQRYLREKPNEKSLPIALVEPNVIGDLLSCPSSKIYCNVKIDNVSGWMKRDEFWGIYQNEYIE